VCIGWCADQVTLRSARCNDKYDIEVKLNGMFSSMWTPGSRQGSVSVLFDVVMKVQFIIKNIRYFQPITWPEGTEWE
jgi:hypothetical protein